MARILIVEDEPELAQALRVAFTDELHAVDVASDGAEGLWAARTGEYDLLILDRMLPAMSGLDVCRELRRSGATLPILMLTARDAPADVIEGLDAGADDYVAKPFRVGVLLARVRAQLRSRAATGASRIEIADLVVDVAAHSVSRGGVAVSLTARECALLEHLAVHRNRIVSKTRLLEAVWERDCDPDSNVVEVYIAALRRKIDRGRGVPLLHTVRGAGYVLREP
ncbi:MAG: response regulator transcription factor [Planctomycetes bacterium]|nr:response regulator transcription factor [Planctomycetota bacterium]